MLPFKYWMRHTAFAPKGFLRYQVLKLLNEKPMSGSELMSEIEKQTGGQWKPSPGSIYPLLAWLQDSGHVKELPTDQSGMKRYELTDSGKVLLNEQKNIIEEQRKMQMKLRKGAKFFAQPFTGAPWLHPPSGETAELRESARKLATAFIELGINLQEHFSKEIMKEAQKTLEETAQKLKEINQKLKETQNE
jgi:DNA-binding PadR family transcriptional regulator